jgi:hypothetical protein
MRTLSALIVCMALTPMSGAKRGTKPATNEPFDTFAALDTKLALLSRQQDQLKQAIAPPRSKATETRAGSKPQQWTSASKKLLGTAKSIEALALRQERRYRLRKEGFGVTAFRSLAKRAAGVEGTALRMSRTRERSVVLKQQPQLDNEVLSLVLQFQAIAGGYGAARCTAKQQPCCLAKDSSDRASKDLVACRWVCAASASGCRPGFLGPKLAR